MNYYTTYGTDPKDGNSDWKREETQDIDTIKSVMNLLMTISELKDSIGQVSRVSWNFQTDGVTTNSKMVISTPQTTMNWESTGLGSSVHSKLDYLNTSAQEQTDLSELLSIIKGDKEKPISQGGVN